MKTRTAALAAALAVVAVPAGALAAKPATHPTHPTHPTTPAATNAAKPTVMFVLHGTLTGYTAVNGTTNGSVALTVTGSNHVAKSLQTKNLTFVIAPSAKVQLEIEVPADLARLQLPEGVDRRLQALLDKQDGGTPLSPDEQAEAEGLVELADLLTLLRLRSVAKDTPTSG